MNIQYLFGNYLSSLPINKICISFCLFCLLVNCMPKLIFLTEILVLCFLAFSIYDLGLKPLNRTITCWRNWPLQVLIFHYPMNLLVITFPNVNFQGIFVAIFIILSHSSLISFPLTSKPLKLRQSRYLLCSKSSSFLAFSSCCDSRYTNFSSRMLIFEFSLLTDASLEFTFSSKARIFKVKSLIRLHGSSIKSF